MSYFTSDFVSFFNELAENNRKEWFHANKKRYEKLVKVPFANLVTDLIKKIGPDELGETEAKDCILRINRDIRFAKDKSPYNTHVTAFISSGGRKNKICLVFLFASPQI